MKASIKFREDQKPLVRAKVPLSVLGLPFQSGVVAGESKELALSLATFFDSGPSLKFAYRPNDSLNPFGIVFKTGIGHFGSPISSPMTMSAEFNLIGSQNPSFFVHFKPQFGDFCVKKSQSSEFVKKSIISKSKSNGALSNDDGSMEVIETPPMMKSGYSSENGLFSGKQIGALQSETKAANLIGRLLIGMEASAKTSLPVMNRAVVNFRWGFRFPASVEEAAARKNVTAGVAIQKLPLLVMNKIGIEHVAHSTKVGPGLNLPRDDDVAETFLAVKRQLQLIQAENGMLRKGMDDLRSEFAAGKSALPATVVDGGLGKNREGERGGKTLGGRADRRSNGDKKSSELNGLGGKAAEGNTKEELRKAAMGGAGAGI